jgi:UDP-N-acetylglucosamine:LPS N-acetylglucosamine transferase
VIDESPGWVYDASNPRRDKEKQGVLTWAQARALARAGAVSIAEDMASEAGGVFMPPIPASSPAALHGALAAYLNEHGQAVSEIVKRAADGEIDKADADAALTELDDALRTLMAVRALLARVAATGEALR